MVRNNWLLDCSAPAGLVGTCRQHGLNHCRDWASLRASCELPSLPERYRDSDVAEPFPTEASGDGGIEAEDGEQIDEEQAAEEETAAEDDKAAVPDETGEDKPQDAAPTTDDVTVEPSDATEDGGGLFD